VSIFLTRNVALCSVLAPLTGLASLCSPVRLLADTYPPAVPSSERSQAIDSVECGPVPFALTVCSVGDSDRREMEKGKQKKGRRKNGKPKCNRTYTEPNCCRRACSG